MGEGMDYATVLVLEARAALRGYLATGYAGFWRKAIDRIRELGVTGTEQWQPSTHAQWALGFMEDNFSV
jgi:hypothetical protein